MKISLPLGNLGWPFIGETLEFISCGYSHSPESFMDKRRNMYGKVFKSHIFGSPTIISTDAEVNRSILQSDAKTFVPSYPKSLTELMGKSSILLINGSLQRRIHGLIGAFFKSPHVKVRITHDMQKYVQQSMANWQENCPVYIQHQAKNAKKRMVKLIQSIIQEKREKNVMSTVNEDVVDVLINNTSEELTDELISDNMIDLMIPGEDSVPVLITLAIKYLSDSPVALQQLTVISETLRLGNIIIGVMRKAVKDVEIKGYLIPKGWCTFAYFRSVHLDDNLYDFPYQFNPWRWQNKDINNSYFTPFGGGQRLCPGIDLARLEASIFLHHFTTQFRLLGENRRLVEDRIAMQRELANAKEELHRMNLTMGDVQADHEIRSRDLIERALKLEGDL
ncbi:3-epi-6-deoxocathasterone 23-monooxygenase [Capsicum annuum]|nr:3-epi-6-deoxocathasterone 23-monooxygenase [Capsicum annuum]